MMSAGLWPRERLCCRSQLAAAVAYEAHKPPLRMQVAGLPERLLNKSASVRGFFLTHHARHFKAHFARLLAAWQEGRLRAAVDPTPFR